MAQHAEAQAAESRNDFIHKMKVAHKELRESIRWLRLILRVPLVEDTSPVAALIRENDELIRIFHTSIKTAQSKKTT
jgi:four helix bundle protein